MPLAAAPWQKSSINNDECEDKMTLMKVIPMLAVAAILGACVPVKGQPGPPVSHTPPPLDQQIRTSDRDDRIRVYSTAGRAKNPGKIRVCLHNSASGRNKGMHWTLTGKPRYIARKKGNVVCDEHPTGTRTVSWHLFKTKGLRMKHVATYDLDVTGREGQQITFAWHRD